MSKPAAGAGSKRAILAPAIGFMRIALASGAARGSLRVALVVGTVLNAINQGGRIVDGTGIQWGHAALNYVVPFCVSCFSAVRMRQREDVCGDSTDTLPLRR